MRSEFALIAAAFNLLPPLSGNANLAVVVNGSGTGLTVAAGSAISTTGAFATVFAQGANVTLTLPVVNGTLATLAGTEALTNKSLNGMTVTSSTGTFALTNAKTLAVTNSLTLSGTDGTTMTFPNTSGTVVTLAQAQTLTNKTLTAPAISSPVLSGTATGTYTLGGTPTLGADITATGHTVTGGTFSGVTLSGATTNSGTISGGTISGATLSGVTFSGPTFSGVSTFPTGTTIDASGVLNFSNTGTSALAANATYDLSITGAAGGNLLSAPHGSVGELLLGANNLGSSGTVAYAYIPSIANSPIGLSVPNPPAHTNYAALVFDRANNKLWFYNAGWVGVVLS